MTGMTINVVMEYTNRQPGLNIAFTHDVDVEVKAELPNKLWTSAGPKTTYPVEPYGNGEAQYFHRVIKYPQNSARPLPQHPPASRTHTRRAHILRHTAICAVNIDFVDRGYAYALDANYLLTVFVKIIVLVGVAKTIMDAIVFYMLPNGVSIVLRNKRSELINRQRAFAELGMKAAISVANFNDLDVNGNGQVKLSDLVRVFGTLEHVNRAQAMQIAKTVIKQAGEHADEGINFAQVPLTPALNPSSPL